MRFFALVLVAALCGLAGCLDGTTDDATPAPLDVNRDGQVVVAVVDYGFNPYHFDFLAEHMPQHLNEDPSDDLPLREDPASWLNGHPGKGAFASYEALKLTTTPEDAQASVNALHDQDMDQWSKVKASSGESVNMYWIPGTKVVGYVTFASGDGFSAASHGVGTSSVSVGNLYGSCPECLLVFVNGASEAANEWVLQQDWIDVQTNSWGLSLLVRDRMYAGSDTELQRASIERGQSVLFSAGNGQANTFTVPNPTLFSSQEGPDWIITVGAISPSTGSSYSGHGKPADIASVGSGYPSAYGGGGTTTAEGSFGGTSNATPVTAGMLAKALYELRKEMATTRMQDGGLLAQGDAACGPANADCALADGNLTVHELQEALFRGAMYTDADWGVGLLGTPVPAGTDETEFIAEGHGSFWGRLQGDEVYAEEWQRIVGFANGTWFEQQDPDQVDWMIADSYCRQSLWGSWEHGYYQEELPDADPTKPMQEWLISACPTVGPAIIAAEKAREGLPV